MEPLESTDVVGNNILLILHILISGPQRRRRRYALASIRSIKHSDDGDALQGYLLQGPGVGILYPSGAAFR